MSVKLSSNCSLSFMFIYVFPEAVTKHVIDNVDNYMSLLIKCPVILLMLMLHANQALNNSKNQVN